MEILSIFIILAGLYVGFSIGANDAANCMGTAVGAGIVKARTAAIIVGILALAGAVIQGQGTIETMGNLASISHIELAVISILLGAALLVTIFTVLGIPVSTTQGIVGAIAGISLLLGKSVDWPLLLKVMYLGFLTPFIAIFFSYFAYRFLSKIILKGKLLFVEKRIKWIVIITGLFLAYSLGANNIGNAMGLIVEGKMLKPVIAAVLGGIALAFGAAALSSSVMETIGKRIVALDPLMAFAAQLGAGLSVFLLTIIKIPTSTSFAIVGGIIGVGLVKGIASVDRSVVKSVWLGWITTPFFSAVFSVIIYKLIALFI